MSKCYDYQDANQWIVLENKNRFSNIDLQVEEIMGECNPTIEPNVYHYYVEIEK
jgi:hypothetical protein